MSSRRVVGMTAKFTRRDDPVPPSRRPGERQWYPPAMRGDAEDDLHAPSAGQPMSRDKGSWSGAITSNASSAGTIGFGSPSRRALDRVWRC